MGKEILYYGQIKGFPLIKINSKEIIEKTRKGSFYMNSLKFYRDLYKNTHDEIIGDPFEGKIYMHSAIMNVNGENITIKDAGLSTPNENDYVYCMFGVNPQLNTTFTFDDEQKKNLIGFNDTALIIMDVYEYCRRIFENAQKNGYQIQSNFVNYYDETNSDIQRMIDLYKKGLENVVFQKRKKYAYQQEYRFTIPYIENVDHIEFNIGDISDISEVFETRTLFNSVTNRIK